MGELLEGFIEANRISFHYKYVFEEDRFSKPTLVVFPGGPGFGLALYEAQISFLVNSVNILFFDPRGCGETPAQGDEDRSEEHTSELQSQSNLVCRLLLEKK